LCQKYCEKAPSSIFIDTSLFCRFPKELIHSIPTIVLFSLEGLRDLDWQRLLKLQMEDGSFLTSPSSTAIAFMETNDEKCLTFLQNAVQKFNGGGTMHFGDSLSLDF